MPPRARSVRHLDFAASNLFRQTAAMTMISDHSALSFSAKGPRVTSTIIDGKAYAASFRARIGEAVGRIAAEGVIPGLAVVLVGDNPASQIYVRNKMRQTVEAGMR